MGTPIADPRRWSGRCGCWHRARPARAILLLAFPVPFLLFITNTVPASRYLNPVLPFVAIFAAWALIELRRGAGRQRRAGALGLVRALRGAARGLAQRRDRSLLPPATTRARWRCDYIESHIPAGVDDPDPALLRRR